MCKPARTLRVVTVTPKGSLTEILRSQPAQGIYALPGTVPTLAGLRTRMLYQDLHKVREECPRPNIKSVI